jgi:hypothetical protein
MTKKLEELFDLDPIEKEEKNHMVDLGLYNSNCNT